MLKLSKGLQNPNQIMFNKSRFTNLVAESVKNRFLNEYASGIKTGRVYGTHKSSSAGQTPARLSGTLGKSLNHYSSIKPESIDVTFTDSSGYGVYLEYGTRNMKPRPGIYNAVEKEKGNFSLMFINTIWWGKK